MVNLAEAFQTYFPANQTEIIAKCPLGKLIYPGKDVRVLASQIPPRDPQWQWVLDSSRNTVEWLLGERRVAPISDPLYLFFPERWLSPAEEAGFMQTVAEHPIVQKNIQAIYILTCSPVILTDFTGDMVKVLTREVPE